jgi:hypothetical protein
MNEPLFAVNDWVASKTTPVLWGRVVHVSPRRPGCVLVAIKGDMENCHSFLPSEIVKTAVPYTHTIGGKVG